VTFPTTFTTVKKHTYRIVVDMNSASGQTETQTATVVAS
jgi:hypothetical protein